MARRSWPHTPSPSGRSRLSPLEVPFIGWSCAAHEFRVKAAELAPKGILPLLVGDPGVGRRCMARAWLHVAGLGEDIPIVDLDREPAELPRRCIGYTAQRPARGRHCHLLGEGQCWNAPEGPSGEPTLPDRLVQLFRVGLYMPPIHRHREIDILAYLDYCNKVRFPRAGFRYSEISAPSSIASSSMTCGRQISGASRPTWKPWSNSTSGPQRLMDQAGKSESCRSYANIESCACRPRPHPRIPMPESLTGSATPMRPPSRYCRT